MINIHSSDNLKLKKIISCIDLTSLNVIDTEEKIIDLCQKANTPLGNVASVCVLPQFVSLAWEQLMSTQIHVATVINFPRGDQPIQVITPVIQQAILDGASELDIVMPLKFKHCQETVAIFIQQCQQLCHDKKILLKIILETGVLLPSEIQLFSEIAIQNGADFLKTSTGKTPVGATPEAVKIMLATIQRSGRSIGLKIAGGITCLSQVTVYIDIFEKILKNTPISPAVFRIGASHLLQQLLQCASQNQN